MTDRVAMALEAIDRFRASRGVRLLAPASRAQLDLDVRALEHALHGGDPYARALDVFDPRGNPPAAARANQSPPPAQPKAPPPPATSEIGARAAAALEAVDFPGFVASLIHGTFDAIVDASLKQMQEYAKLVASLSQTLEDFTRDNVTRNSARDLLAARHPQDLIVMLPSPGETSQPRLLPRPEREGESPTWLATYGLTGQRLTEELTEGVLLEKGQLAEGESRLQSLATLVLMGVNRIVISDGDVKAKLQFHATARDVLRAEAQQIGANIAARSQTGASTQMLVSTVKANAQTEASIKADLMGEVRIAFRSETFPLERFADSAAIQLINRHARWKTEPGAAAPATAVPPAAASEPSAPTPTPRVGGEP